VAPQPKLNPHAELEAAVARIRHYCAFIDRISPSGAFNSPNVMVARVSVQAMEAAQCGLDALAQLPSHQRVSNANRKARALLDAERTNSALRFLVLRDHAVIAPEVVSEGVDPDADQETLEVLRQEIDKQLSVCRQLLAQTELALKVVLGNLETGQHPEMKPDLKKAHFWGVTFRTFECSQIVSLTTYRLLTHARDLAPAFKETLTAHFHVLQSVMPATKPAWLVLNEDNPEPQAVAAVLETIENIPRQIDGTALQMCLAAARELESESSTWAMALECADATRAYGAAFLEEKKRRLRDFEEANPGRVDLSIAAADMEGPGSASTASAVASPSGKAPAQGGRRKSTRGGARQRAQAMPPAQGATPAQVPLALDRARQALGRSRPVTRAMANGDPVEIARSLGHSTETIDLLRSHGTDPAYIADVVRSSLPKWFGDVKALQAARAALDALLSGTGTDTEAERLHEELGERIATLEAVTFQAALKEIEDIKQYPFPKEKHLERLVEAGAIAKVRPPNRLASPGDVGTKGMLFEMEVVPTPLADGSPAPALYLHLHAERPVAPEVAARMPLSQFTAVHVKSAQQRALGKKWETMQQQLGYDANVHRGPVGSRVLARLRQISEA